MFCPGEFRHHRVASEMWILCIPPGDDIPRHRHTPPQVECEETFFITIICGHVGEMTFEQVNMTRFWGGHPTGVVVMSLTSCMRGSLGIHEQ